MRNTIKDKDRMSLLQAAKKLGMSKPGFIKIIESGNITAHEIDGFFYIMKSDFEKLKEQRKSITDKRFKS